MCDAWLFTKCLKKKKKILFHEFPKRKITEWKCSKMKEKKLIYIIYIRSNVLISVVLFVRI